MIRIHPASPAAPGLRAESRRDFESASAAATWGDVEAQLAECPRPGARLAWGGIPDHHRKPVSRSRKWSTRGGRLGEGGGCSRPITSELRDGDGAPSTSSRTARSKVVTKPLASWSPADRPRPDRHREDPKRVFGRGFARAQNSGEDPVCESRILEGERRAAWGSKTCTPAIHRALQVKTNPGRRLEMMRELRIAVLPLARRASPCGPRPRWGRVSLRVYDTRERKKVPPSARPSQPRGHDVCGMDGSRKAARGAHALRGGRRRLIRRYVESRGSSHLRTNFNTDSRPDQSTGAPGTRKGFTSQGLRTEHEGPLHHLFRIS